MCIDSGTYRCSYSPDQGSYSTYRSSYSPNQGSYSTNQGSYQSTY